MTYCAAWKKEGKVFLISDTAISQNCKETEFHIGSFGEHFGIYNNYSVKESKIKIVKVNNKIAIAFSGMVTEAKDAIDSLKINIEYYNLETALNLLEETNPNSGFELIIISHEAKNKIYHFDGLKVIEINDFIDIGSGKYTEYFSKNVSDYINSSNKCIEVNNILLLKKDYDFDEEEYLVDVLAYVQTLSLSKSLVKNGAGGLFFGLYIDTEVKWCRDLLYYIFNDEITNFRTVSVNERENMVFSYSDYNCILRCYSNDVGDYKELIENKYLQKSIYKSLVESFSDYVILCNMSNNDIFVTKINKWPYNNFFRIWMKRNEENTKYAFAFSYYYKILKDFIDNFNEDFKLYNIICKAESFVPREDYVGQFTLENVDDIEVEYDFDLRALEFDYKISQKFMKRVDESISRYHNIVIIDYKYLFDSVLEKYNKYKFAEINLDNLKLEPLINNYFRNIASKDFQKYGFYIIKDKDIPHTIDEFSLYNWLSDYDNCMVYETKNGESKKTVCKFIFEMTRKYYFDEKYFGIDKLIICCDDKQVNEVLSYLPQKNFESENPDIFLIRNCNQYTNMDGRFRYVVLDNAIPFMLGYNIHEIQLLESGYVPKQEEY